MVVHESNVRAAQMGWIFAFHYTNQPLYNKKTLLSAAGAK